MPSFIGIVFTLVLHALMIAALIVGPHLSLPEKKREVPAVNAIQATLVQRPKPKAQAPVIDLTRQREKALQQANEQKRLAKERARQEKIKRDKAKADRLAKEKKKQLERQRLQREKEQKQQQEALRKAEELKKQQQAAKQQAFDQLLNEELNAMQAEETLAEVALVASSIESQVTATWNRPPSARRGMSVELRVALLPNGRLISVDIMTSSGHDLFDRSAVKAVELAQPFAMVESLSSETFNQHFKQFKFRFQPLDLRQ